MNTIDKVLLEWSLKTDKGYPDVNSKEDMDLFESMFGFKLNEEEESKEEVVTQVSTEDLTLLRKAFESIKEPYSRYLSVFNYFDPYSLGTISEVLLTKLLNRVDNVKAKHVGGGQGLADLIVNDHPISLKTTSAKKAIGLGSDELTTNAADSKEVVAQLKQLYSKNPELENIPVKELKNKIPSNVFNLIQDKLTAIAKKLTGENNKELFVWVEKEYVNNIMSAIVIHTLKYDYKEIMDEFMDSTLFISSKGKGKAYGMKDPSGTTTIVPDTGAKLLNIHPDFVRKSTKDSKIRVNLVTNLKAKPEELKEKLPERFFQSLDKIYNELFN